MKVLLGVGGSEDSFRALDRTVTRATQAGDELTIVVVENPASDLSPDEIEARIRDRLSESDIHAPIRTVSGDPGSALVELAENEGFDQVVLGGGQRSPMGKIQIGHIAEFVLLNSHVTVTLVR